MVDLDITITTKGDIRMRNHQRQDEQANKVYGQLTPELKRCVDLAKQKGSSSWVFALPIKQYGFFLHKGEFRDTLCLQNGWKLNDIPQTCNCGTQFTVDLAMICHMRGFLTICHNEIHDILASLLTEVCNNVATKPQGEHTTGHSANTDDGASVHMSRNVQI